MSRILLVLGLVLGFTLSAQANDDGYGSRYSVKANKWDREFGSYYGYKDPHCGHRATCYDGVTYSDNVYIEERVIERGHYRGYTITRVYRRSSYRQSDLVVTYYSHGRRVVRRSYYYTRVNDYYYPGYSRTYVSYHQIDEATLNFALAVYTGVAAVQILAGCDTGSCVAVAAALGLSASASSAAAAEARKTQLQKQIDASRERADSGLDID